MVGTGKAACQNEMNKENRQIDINVLTGHKAHASTGNVPKSNMITIKTSSMSKEDTIG